MDERRRWAGFGPVPAIAAAFALTGCATTHVGEDWQCPLAQGAACTSVVDADPAVAGEQGADSLATAVPLYRPKTERPVTGTGAGRRNRRACETDRRAFAWLGARFGGGVGGTPDDPVDTANACPANAGADTVMADRTGPRHSHRGFPPVMAPAPPSTAREITPTEQLREPEVIGRVWIAPFVDGDGIYREAAWVRVVIAPARWRLP